MPKKLRILKVITTEGTRTEKVEYILQRWYTNEEMNERPSLTRNSRTNTRGYWENLQIFGVEDFSLLREIMIAYE